MSYTRTYTSHHISVMTLVRHLVALVLCFAFSGASGATVTPSFKLVSDTLVPYTVQGTHKGYMMLEAKGLTDQSNLSLEVGDLGKSGPADMSVSVSPPTDIGGRDGSHFWAVELSFTKLPENETLLTRYLTITLNKALYALPYKIQVNKRPPKPVFSWELNGPPKDWLAESAMTAFSVKTGQVGATNVSVIHSTLQDEETKRLISPADLVLCLSPKQCVAANHAPVNLLADRLQTVFLRLAKQPPPGSYKGIVSIGADETDLAKPLELNVYVSSVYWQGLGIGLIVFGIVIAWFVNVHIASKRAWLEAMRPAAKLKEELKDLDKRRHEFETLTKVPQLTETKSTIEQWVHQLGQGFLLDNDLLPKRITLEWPNKEKYGKHLTSMENRVASLTLIVEEGVEHFRKNWATYDDNKRKSAEEPLRLLDAYAKQARESERPDEYLKSIRAGVQKVINDFERPERREAIREEVTTEGEGLELTPHSIDVTLSRLNHWNWVLWGVVTTLVGWAVLILNDPGFGTDLDLVKSFLWGLGVQVAGQGLQQLTPSTIMASFSLSLPGGKK